LFNVTAQCVRVTTITMQCNNASNDLILLIFPCAVLLWTKVNRTVISDVIRICKTESTLYIFRWYKARCCLSLHNRCRDATHHYVLNPL